MFRKQDTHIHFVGIGGIGMSGIAEVLVNLGYTVTGTDLAQGDTTRRLAGLGATVHQGHDESHLGDADVVVVSSAVDPQNPEIRAARARSIPVIPRAEMLAELMRLKQGIAIAGSHGKTTTTSLTASILHAGGIDPTVVIGGKLNSLGTNARLGSGDVLLTEADESDGSFTMLSPWVAVITNIDREHLDHYGTHERLMDTFVSFANRVPFYGLSVVCLDDPHVRTLLPRLSKRTVTYGLEPGADYVARNVRHVGPAVHFEVEARGRSCGEFRLGMPGIHNALNAVAAIAVADELDVAPEAWRAALDEFEGVQRRFTLRGDVTGVVVVDDYGHHPTEIVATLAGARASYADRRVIAVVQPHRYTRLRDNFDGFAQCVGDADVVVLADIYPAGEPPLPGVTVEALADRIRRVHPRLQVVIEKDLDAMPDTLAAMVRSGDVVLTLGAGSVTRVGARLVATLRQRAHVAQ